MTQVYSAAAFIKVAPINGVGNFRLQRSQPAGASTINFKEHIRGGQQIA
jgi:hypothetical protein